ncbi:MFS transporter [Caulobacter sp. NIBR2454]|uniref:MFS transporter n=1 Tax=Caulobacter sp. NIBR2454 TaxID=3015996 RepID=UPI0022B66BA3|nr:MFS transporter [Caulobacter sp. NIBR2454]
MFLAPEENLTEEARERGVRQMVVESAFSNTTGAMTSGVILTAFALYLGASNAVIGLLAALPFWTQLLQAPSVVLIERLRTRKRIAVIVTVLGRATLIGTAVLAFFPGGPSLAALLAAQLVYCAAGAVGGCAWNAWIRDLAPEQRLGEIIAKRTIWATLVSMVAGLAAAYVLDATPRGSDMRGWAFFGLYIIGCLFGMISAWIVARMPEPPMPAAPEKVDFFALLRAPFGDANFRRLIAYLASWQFAANLATPFFTVFFVRQLGFSMTFVVLLSVVSQLANLVALRSWGLLSDRFSNKSVLGFATPIFLLCIAGMVGASQISDRTWASAYLIGLHLLMGLASAGVTLATANIALKLSPKGSATAYVAASAMVSSAAAGLAPVLGGLFADFFSVRALEVALRWTSPDGSLVVRALRLSNWDFFFLIAAILGLYALHRLSMVREEGEIDGRRMRAEVLSQARQVVRNLSPVAGLRHLTEIPGAFLREGQVKARLTRARTNAGLDTPAE